ncbi:MAG: hypothetical protein ACI8X5_000368 [Planctomycetota bacterium]|jgi:hypothetical protein
MSFQGDVGGIGLAELLQSLSRGRREGVLRLQSRSGLSTKLGLSDGVVTFLPEDDEDSQTWREKVRQSWSQDFDDRMVAMRMSEVARAHRIQRVYDILDSEEVHFRFEPQDLPAGPSGQVVTGGEEANAAHMGEVHCKGLAVELLLLEYARMSDEAEGAAGRLGFTNYVVPRTLDPGGADERQIRFLQECDGKSTLAEISDRMGWPLRQSRLVFLDYLQRGEVRLAEYRELLVLAQKELSQGHISRASSRLVGWIQASPPGMLELGDAQLLAAEFKSDRMGPLLNLMPSKEARTLLRRIDLTIDDPGAAVKHWRELQRLKRSDLIIEVHRLGIEFHWEEDEEMPSLRELLDMARQLREDEHPGRAAAFLRMAASREPANANSRLDIGLGMLGVGLIEEAAAWILDACQILIGAGHAEKAIAPLRALLEVDNSIHEARRMLGRLKHLTIRRRLLQKNSAIGLAIVGILATTAWVRVSSEHKREFKLAEIANLIDKPIEAESLLETYFPDDPSPRIEHLREVIHDRRKFIEMEWRNEWNETYREAQLACSLGEPEEGLSKAMALNNPPKLTLVDEPWPLLSDLYNGLAARLENDREALGDTDLDDQNQVEKEKVLVITIGKVQAVLGEVQDNNVDIGDLPVRLELIANDLRIRVKDRVDRLESRDRAELLSRQDLLLAAARAHDSAGSLEHAIDVYENLMATDSSGQLEGILEQEVTDLHRRQDALMRARTLASNGEHEAALEVLADEFDNPREHKLPWVLDVFPADALVHLADGSTRAVPFVFESRAGERVEFHIEYKGHRSEDLVIHSPSDQHIWLSKTPQRSWSPGGRIDALPVAVGQDQIVSDRTGNIARLTASHQPIWSTQVLSLGGIGRAPVFLPAKPDHLLLLTEDGEAWMVDSRNGELKGPWVLGHGPAEGPAQTSDGVLARLKDGRMMYWEKRVKPVERKKATIDESERNGNSVGMAVLYRGEGENKIHSSPWTDWSVDLLPNVYRIYKNDDPVNGFAVMRSGDWTYLAWEAPSPDVPTGRLWISDASGLAAYTE